MILIDDLTKLYDFQGGDPVTLSQHALMELHECVHSYVIEAGFYDISQLCMSVCIHVHSYILTMH
jgi:hypothetical protein